MHDYLKLLNDRQRQAVEHIEGPAMVLAGAGSGKTRVLTCRVAHLMDHGVESFNIMALTFTNKAAREMRSRIEQIAGAEAKNLWMNTFHSLFARLLRIEADKLGYPSTYTIYDTEDSKSMIKGIVKELSLDDKVYKPSSIHNRISSVKNEFIKAKDYLENSEMMYADNMARMPRLGEIYQRYEQRCFKAAAMDFDDLLLNTYELFLKFPEVLYKYQNKFTFLLVDEFQDTNILQYLILKKLAARTENICVVGDDAQSIYGFRGASIANILNFKKDYPDTKLYKLEQNYRSTQTIVGAANSVIVNNKSRLHKEVWTDNLKGENIKIFSAVTDNDEGKSVANAIFELKHRNQLRNSDFAVLYRTNYQSRAFEEALRKLNIPYRVYGGLSFYKRKEIKDLLAYFSLTINHKDEEALKRVLNYPARGIGNTTEEKIVVAAGEKGVSLWDVIENPGLLVNEGTKRRLDEFVTMIKSFSVMVKKLSGYDLAVKIAISSGIIKDLREDKTGEGLNRYNHVEELLNSVKEFCDRTANNPLFIPEFDVEENNNNVPEFRTLDEFMRDIALYTDADEDDKDENNDKVLLMTVHAAKGLEFPYVFVAGLEENLFPSLFSSNTREEVEEERRLFYVALTRAMKKVFLSYSDMRFRWGNFERNEPSRFLKEIAPEYIEWEKQPESDWRDNTNGERADYTLREPVKEYKRIKPVSGDTKFFTGRKKLVRMNKAIASDPVSAANLQIHEGMEVEHQRFGTGKVIRMEGTPSNGKAIINFNGVGQKMLLLKFAKLKVLG